MVTLWLVTRLVKLFQISDYSWLRRLECHNGLQPGSLRLIGDKPLRPTNAHDFEPGTESLWRREQERRRNLVSNLAPPFPKFRTHEDGPISPLIFAMLLGFTAFWIGPSNWSDQFSRSLAWPQNPTALAASYIAWVQEPEYAGGGHIRLGEEVGSRTESTITVLAGSVFHFRARRQDGVEITQITKTDTHIIHEPQAEDSAEPQTMVAIETPLLESSQLVVAGLNIDLAWDIRIIQDQLPMIEVLNIQPGRQPRSIALTYRVHDDFAPEKIHVRLVPGSDENALSVLASDEIVITPPSIDPTDPSNINPTTTILELAEHPFAGGQVELTLIVTDQAGQVGESQSYKLLLPEPAFAHPIAKGLAEMRQRLAFDLRARPAVLSLFEAIKLNPDAWVPDSATYLHTDAVHRMMEVSYTISSVSPLLDELWELAQRYENAPLHRALDELAQAKKELEAALANQTDGKKIQELIEQLQQRLAELAEQLPESKHLPQKEGELLDLKSFFDKLAEHARQGRMAQAQKLLEQMERRLQNARRSRQNQMSQEQAEQMQRLMRELDDIIAQQKSLRDRTEKQSKQESREDNANPQDQEKNQHQDPSDRGQALAQAQQDLAQRLEQLLEQLENNNLTRTPSMGEAKELMRGAGESLKGKALGDAQDLQNDALDALRQGQQELARQMQEQFGRGMARLPRGADPFMEGKHGFEGELLEDFTGEPANERAAKILKELQEKLGREGLKAQERRYLQELIKRF